jgi:hypothetical protein
MNSRLGRSGADALLAGFAGAPGLAIAPVIDGTLAGVAFGHPPDGEDGATLAGITVDDARTAHVLGAFLPARFEPPRMLGTATSASVAALV